MSCVKVVAQYKWVPMTLMVGVYDSCPLLVTYVCWTVGTLAVLAALYSYVHVPDSACIAKRMMGAWERGYQSTNPSSTFGLGRIITLLLGSLW